MTNQTKNSNIQKELGRHGLTAVPESCNQTSVVSSNQFGGNYAKLNVGIGTKEGNAASFSIESDAWKHH